MEEVITYAPEVSSIIKWLAISGLILVLSIILAIRFVKPGQNKSKFNSLFFLLSGFMGLISLTIFAFMLFNLIKTKPVELSRTQIVINGEAIPLSEIRRTQIHRENNGIPFQGIGVQKGTNNSLIIELSDGKAKILSEDFYPIKKIADKIGAFKKR